MALAEALAVTGRDRLHGLWLFLGAYVTLFAVAGLLLFTPLLGPGGDPTPPHHPGAAGHWAHGAQGAQGTGLELLWPHADPDLLNCTALQEVKDLEFVAAGWTKAVYRGRLRYRDVAVKTVNLNGQDIRACQGKEPGATLAACYRRAAAKILKEMVLLHQLRHPNIVQVGGGDIPYD